MPNLVYSNPDFLPFTKIVSADMNAKLNDIKNRFNWDGTTATTGLGDSNIQSNTVTGGGLTRASKLKAGTADYVLINDATGKMSEEQALAISRGGLGQVFNLTGQAGKGIVVDPSETSFSFGTPTTDRLTQVLHADIGSLTAGEDISANDAVCLDLHNGSGSNVYRFFRCDSDIANRRRNFLGFSVSAVSTTPNIKTWTDDADLITGNVIGWSINGRSYTQSFSVDNDTTLAAIAASIASDPDVFSAVVTNAGSSDRVITITSRGGLSLNIPTPSVTGGSSQAAVAIVQTQAASGGNVTVRNFGVMSGFSGLITGYNYYLSQSAGAITESPADTSPIFVGQALSSTILFVTTNVGQYQFSTPVVFIKSHGGSTGSTPANGQANSEHFNFTSWSAGTADTGTERSRLHCGESFLNDDLVVVDGLTTSTTVVAMTRLYNKSTWSSGAGTRATPLSGCGVGELANNLYFSKGSTSGAHPAAVANNDKWNGSAWSVESAYSNAAICPSTFTQGGLVRTCGGLGPGGSGISSHETYDGSSVSTDTAAPFTNAGAAGSRASGSTGLASIYTGTSYEWSGSSWGSGVSIGYTTSADNSFNAGPSSGYNQGTSNSYVNGGESSSVVSVSTTAKYNGSSWSADTSSTTARAGAQGAIF